MDIRAELKDLMESKNYSIAYVSTATGIAKSTISMWMNGNYNGKNDKITDAINNFIQREYERSGNSDLPFVDISTVKYITEIGRLCHTQGKIGVCVGRASLICISGCSLVSQSSIYLSQYFFCNCFEGVFVFTSRFCLITSSGFKTGSNSILFSFKTALIIKIPQ